MVDITFFCKHCGNELICDSTGSGQTVPCPECKKQVTIPTTATPSIPELIKFACPACRQKIEAPSDMQGEDVECPACGQGITLKRPVAEKEPLSPRKCTFTREQARPLRQQQFQNEKSCPFCGEVISFTALKCINCGSLISQNTQNSNVRPQLNLLTSEGTPQQLEALSILTLIVPIIVALIPTNGSVILSMIFGIVMILFTALVIACEAYLVKAGSTTDTKPNGKRREGFIIWFFATLLLWIIAFPMWMFRRAQYGLRNLGVISVFVVTSYFIIPFITPVLSVNGISLDRLFNPRLSTSELRNQVIVSIREKLGSSIKITYFDLTHKEGNEYAGVLEICDVDKTNERVTLFVDVTSSGSEFRWHIKPKEDTTLLTSDPAILGKEWGEGAGKFALSVSKEKRIYERSDGLAKIWNFYYRDKYRPDAPLSVDNGGDRLIGAPYKEKWEKTFEYEQKLVPVKEEASAAWEKLATDGVVGKCLIKHSSSRELHVWDNGAYNKKKTDESPSYKMQSNESSDLFQYDAETEMLKIADCIRSYYSRLISEVMHCSMTKELDIEFSNSPSVPCKPTKVQEIMEKAVLIGVRFRYVSITEPPKEYGAKIKGYLEEFAILDANNQVLFYWKDNMGKK